MVGGIYVMRVDTLCSNGWYFMLWRVVPYVLVGGTSGSNIFIEH